MNLEAAEVLAFSLFLAARRIDVEEPAELDLEMNMLLDLEDAAGEWRASLHLRKAMRKAA